MTPELWSFTTGLGGADLRGMSVEALDGSIGTVEAVAEALGGAYVVVDTGRWIFGKTVVLPAGVVRAVDYDRRCVFVECSRDDVKNAPEHDPEATDGGGRAALDAYYGALRRRDDRAEQHSSTEPGSGPAATPPHAEPGPARAEADIASPVHDTAAPMPDDRPAQLSSPASGGSGPTAERSDETSPTQTPPRAEVTPPSTGTPPAAPPDERTAAPEATDQVGHKPSGSTQSPPSPAREASDDSDRPRTRRFARDSGDASGTPASGDRSSDAAQPPIGRYDSLTATEIVARLRSLSQGELATLERYEQRHDGRQTILSRIASLREDEPWRGYDDATVPEIRRALAEADEERAKRVRDYERRHRDRKGVMEAARRAVAAA